MNDKTDVGTAPMGKGGKKPADAGGAMAKGVGPNKAGGAGNAKSEGQIGRMLVRAIWGQEWALANPDGKGEDRKAAWLAARDGALEKNLKTYRRALSSLTRSGVTMTLSAVAKKDGAAQEDGGED